MKRAYTFQEIREAEARAIAQGTTASALMERAGAALAREVEQEMRGDCIFVCGGGNNGGDGFVAARLLAEKHLDVAVLCLAEHFTQACEAAKGAYYGELFNRIPRRRYSLVVDCLFGIGLNRPIEGENLDLVTFIESADRVIACDIPSGLSEGGVALGCAVRADVTVTMGAMKQALLLADGADLCGKICVADIGLPLAGGAEVWEDADVRARFPRRKSHSNKGDYGSVSILAGHGMLGAPLLSVGAALKSGAGYTELWLPSSAYAGMDAAQSAAARAADQAICATVTAKYPACIVNLYDGEPFFCKALAYGMGAGTGPLCKNTLEEIFSTYTCGTLVLDADALNTLAACGVDMLRKKQCSVIVTPHPKEMSRLTDRPVGEVLSDPVGVARAFSKQYGVVVVLKNNRTVIAEGDRIAINPTGSPALAKAGSGDALAGFITGLAARLSPFEAAVVGCFIHGRAGEIAAEEMGEYAPDATDIIARLYSAMLSV